MSSLIGIGKILTTPKNVSLGIMSACMVGRPLITMSNQKVPIETRKYTATRELGTEVFGLINTYTIASAIEKFVPKIIAKKVKLDDVSKKGIDFIKNTDWAKLTNPQQKVKGAVLLSSFVGTALSVAVLTPLLNNAVLNKIMDRLSGKNKEETAPTQVKTNSFQKINTLKLNA